MKIRLADAVMVGMIGRKEILTCVRNLVWAWLILVFVGLAATFALLAGCPPTPVLASHLAPAEPLPARPDPAAIVMEYVDGRRTDPLLQLDDFVWVKASNYRGVEIDGQTYYYRLAPHASFDPLSRGAVDERTVRIWKLIRDTEFTVIIYTLEMPGASHA